MAKPAPADNPKKQPDSFLAKCNPEITSLALRFLNKMRKHLPGSLEMVYANYHALVIGCLPNERPSDAIFSIVLHRDHVSLCFLQGAGIPDPKHRLLGSGHVARHLRIGSLSSGTLDEPEIVSLNAALHRARVPPRPKTAPPPDHQIHPGQTAPRRRCNTLG
jgi:hypothetical protein